jgi:hypothetical protein
MQLIIARGPRHRLSSNSKWDIQEKLISTA